MCNALTNTCEANQAAKDLCARAEAAANAATPLTGAQADGPCFPEVWLHAVDVPAAFNAVFNETSNFASVTPIDNTGKPLVQ
jgi:hypothetical protein